jgi:hypothetical protein
LSSINHGNSADNIRMFRAETAAALEVNIIAKEA